VRGFPGFAGIGLPSASSFRTCGPCPVHMTTVIAPVPGATGASMKPDGTKLRAVNATIDRTVRILRTEGSPNPSPVQSKLIPDRLADNSDRRGQPGKNVNDIRQPKAPPYRPADFLSAALSLTCSAQTNMCLRCASAVKHIDVEALALAIDLRGKNWCPGADLNHRHADFQSTSPSGNVLKNKMFWARIMCMCQIMCQ